MSHYTGHVPEGETKLQDLKCALNTRMPLQRRIAPVQLTHEALESTRRARSAGPEPIRSYFLQKRFKGETTYTESTKEFVRSADEVPTRRKEPKAECGECNSSSFEFRSTNQEGSAAIAEGSNPAFYSEARKIERIDDDARRNVTVAPTRAGASHFQRTVDIMRRRETDPKLQPPAEHYNLPPRRAPNGLPPPSAADLVRFTHISPLTTNQTDFRDPSAVLGDRTSLHLTHSSRQITQLASSADLFCGTAKAREDLAPGFMGHVPAHESNVRKLQGARDLLRLYSKCSVNVAQPSKNNQRLIESHSTSTTDPNAARTVAAFMERQVFANSKEQNMNRLEHGRQNAVRKFFSHGAGDADTTLADQFCVKFRPGGGLMKIGPSSSWSWIADRDLKRTTMI